MGEGGVGAGRVTCANLVEMLPQAMMPQRREEGGMVVRVALFRHVKGIGMTIECRDWK